MGTYICALPTGESAAPTVRRMLASHTRAPDKARQAAALEAAAV